MVGSSRRDFSDDFRVRSRAEHRYEFTRDSIDPWQERTLEVDECYPYRTGEAIG
jgi:hypothetical protein